MVADNLQPGNIRDEVDRLSTNMRSFIDVMPEMVFLLGDNGSIEYMNQSAVQYFGSECSEAVKDDMHALFLRCKEQTKASQESDTPPFIEAYIENTPVECSCFPYRGYKNDNLLMLVIRDITARKMREEELRNFNTNIEDILQRKIAELKESEEIMQHLSRQVNSLKTRLGSRHEADKMIGSSAKMREMREMIYQVAPSDTTILITGESGTGKELAASLLRALSSRNDKPFFKINCNTINDSILESDLFGYEKGAFTGATARKVGKFEVVNGGTIFLDEIGDISPRMQASLLRVLQNGEIVRVGGNKPVQIDVRVIAATNVDLAEAVKKKKFRLDLYYRLNIINVDIPPLRERKEDIVELVSHFVSHYRRAFKKEIDLVPQSIINKLLMHDWPGNVRELENVIQRAVLMAKDKMLTEEDLLFNQETNSRNQEGTAGGIGNGILEKIGKEPLKMILAEFESEVIFNALKRYEGNVSLAADKLHIGKTAMYDKMKRYNISAKSLKPSRM